MESELLGFFPQTVSAPRSFFPQPRPAMSHASGGGAGPGAPQSSPWHDSLSHEAECTCQFCTVRRLHEELPDVSASSESERMGSAAGGSGSAAGSGSASRSGGVSPRDLFGAGGDDGDDQSPRAGLGASPVSVGASLDDRGLWWVRAGTQMRVRSLVARG